MIIAGAGGHSLEVTLILKDISDDFKSLRFFDQDESLILKSGDTKFVTKINELKDIFRVNPVFYLGIGNPVFREKLDLLLTEIGGELKQVHAKTSVIQSEIGNADVLSFGFVGPDVYLGRGVLVNTRAHVHHQCRVGDYTEISPGAILLGNVKVGRKCRIGAGAVILPGVKIGDNSIIGAGAVVVRDVSPRQKVAGVPAKKL